MHAFSNVRDLFVRMYEYVWIGESMHWLVQRKIKSSSLKLPVDPYFPVCAPAHRNHFGCDCAEENDHVVVPEVTTLNAFRYIGEEQDI